jgi:hypothetical protein
MPRQKVRHVNPFSEALRSMAGQLEDSFGETVAGARRQQLAILLRGTELLAKAFVNANPNGVPLDRRPVTEQMLWAREESRDT